MALITGVTGQDGAYLAQLLLDKGYVVHGLKRRSSSFNTGRIDHLYRDPHESAVRFFLHHGDLSDATGLARLVLETAPDEIYNLGAESHVEVSFELPEYTADANALGTLRLLEAVRLAKAERRVRFYHASTSELYGNAATAPQDETTPFAPVSRYAVGTPCKVLDVSRIRALGWRPRIGLEEGPARTYRWFVEHVAATTEKEA